MQDNTLAILERRMSFYGDEFRVTYDGDYHAKMTIGLRDHWGDGPTLALALDDLAATLEDWGRT